MKRLIVLCCLMAFVGTLCSQEDKEIYSMLLTDRTDSLVIQQYRQVEPFFIEAYSLYPSVPRGMLEAVAFTYTRFLPRLPLNELENENVAPVTYGLMGLTLDGRGFFRDNLRLVSELSGFAIDGMVSSPHDNVVAYAAAYAALQKQMGIYSTRFDAQLPILTALSELPVSEDSVLAFALHSSLYAMAVFVDNDRYRSAMGILVERPDYRRCFGKYLPLLRSAKVRLPSIGNGDGRSGDTDYDGAVWIPAGTCNYTVGRGGHTVSAVTIHYTQGTYASAIAWFRNCTYNGVGAQASAHYLIRSIDGQVTQMVREADKAWHVGNCNPYTIGIEHEAYGDIASFFTPEMYQSSARLVRDICDRNGISPHRMFYRDTLDDGTVLNNGTHNLGGEGACVKIRGHQHFPGQTHTDPGPFWNWNYYYKLVNDDTPIARFTAPSGTLTDSGGPDFDYGNDERQLLLIQVDEARSITLSFSEFDLEDNYDFLWIYDGATVYAPLIGRWNTTSPGTVTSSGNALLVEFRSDCATTAAGWKAVWEAEIPHTNHCPETEILWDEQQWVTGDTSLSFVDTDDGEIPYRFYQVIGSSGSGWTANPDRGFAYDDFDRLNLRLWSVLRGNWRCEGGRLVQSGAASSEIGIPLRVNTDAVCLYEFDMVIPHGEDAGRAAGILLYCSGASSRRDAYSIAAYPEESQVRIYRHLQGQDILLYTINGVATEPGVNYHYRIIRDVPAGKIVIVRDNLLLGQFRERSVASVIPGIVRVSLFTSGTDASFDNFRAFRGRGTSVNLSVGSGNCDILWQALEGSATTMVRSVVIDDQGLFSDVAEKNLLVDYTPPLLRGTIVGGLSESTDLSSALLQTSFRWRVATDPHSGVTTYKYGWSLTQSDTANAIVWMGQTASNSIVFRPRVLLPRSYYFVVCAVNGAGLWSEPIFSEVCHPVSVATVSAGTPYDGSERDGVGDILLAEDGSVAVPRLKAILPDFLHLWPNPTNEVLNVCLPESMLSLAIFDACGQEVYERRFGGTVLRESHCEERVDVSTFRPGIYFVRVVGRNGRLFSAKFLKQ